MQFAPEQTKGSEDFHHTQSQVSSILHIKKPNITLLLTTSFFTPQLIEKKTQQFFIDFQKIGNISSTNWKSEF